MKNCLARTRIELELNCSFRSESNVNERKMARDIVEEISTAPLSSKLRPNLLHLDEKKKKKEKESISLTNTHRIRRFRVLRNCDRCNSTSKFLLSLIRVTACSEKNRFSGRCSIALSLRSLEWIGSIMDRDRLASFLLYSQVIQTRHVQEGVPVKRRQPIASQIPVNVPVLNDSPRVSNEFRSPFSRKTRKGRKQRKTERSLQFQHISWN